MREVLISIQPKWCELIASGKKTVEVRKTRPKTDVPFKCYIYQTKLRWVYTLLHALGFFAIARRLARGTGKVIGEFVCDCIANYEAELWDDETYERIQEFFEPDDFAEYGEYEYKTVADNGDDFWRDNRLCNSSCLTIEELRKYVGTGIATFYGWGISDLVIYDKPKELHHFFKPCGDCDKKGTRRCTEELTYCRAKVITRPPQSWCYVELLKGGAE